MNGGTPQQTTTTQISPQAQALFQTALPGIQKFAAAPPPAPYPGTTVAPFTPVQQQAQSDILSGASKAGQVADWATGGVEGIPGSLAGSTVPTSSDIFNDPGIWNPDYNAGLSSAITAAQRPTWQALTEQALPAIRGGEITAGGYGGSRGDLAGGLATSRAFQTASDQAAKMAEDVYGANLGAVNSRYATNLGANVTQRQQDLNSVLAAYGLAPSLQQQALLPGVAAGAVGDAQQQQAQNELNAEVAKYQYTQLAPFLQSQDILSLLGSIPGATTVSTGNVPTPNPITGALGGAAGGAALGALIPGGAPVGAGLGAVAGTLPFFFNRTA